jgi:hypothetical protein
MKPTIKSPFNITKKKSDFNQLTTEEPPVQPAQPKPIPTPFTQESPKTNIIDNLGISPVTGYLLREAVNPAAFQKAVTEKKSEFLATLRYYFDISNSYILHKLRVVLFPFIGNIMWDRQRNQDTLSSEYKSGK